MEISDAESADWGYPEKIGGLSPGRKCSEKEAGKAPERPESTGISGLSMRHLLASRCLQ
jgi:hypothetical protein